MENAAQDDVALPPKTMRTWSVKTATLLLCLQGVGLGILAYYTFSALAPEALPAPLSFGGFLALLFTSSTAQVCLAALALVSAFSFFLLRPLAWTLALLLQGLMLLLGLAQYFQAKPFYVYFLLGFGIFMVIYLYNPDVRAAFPLEAAGAEPEVAE
jgi:hypothetical protein